ncbi:ESF1 homolog [Nephila pilipes]|uniref:ESF1 homolog n=1 Tax=Nephila pilipes TaxID=299642 RepID=A0A8X6U9J7_NEPPI|nr:ESF1 homolog [Nephila pilipes]
MFENNHFKVGGKIDERGRFRNFKTSENLKKLYNYKNSSDEDFSDSEQDAKNGNSILKSKQEMPSNKGSLKKAKPITKSKGETDNLHTKKSKHFKEKTDKQDHKIDSSLLENFKSRDNVSDMMKEENKSSSTNERDKSKIAQNTSHNSANYKIKQQSYEVQDEMSSSDYSEEDDDDEDESDLSGEHGVLESEESDDSESDDESSDAEDFDHQWNEQHQQAPDSSQIYKRLAVCSMDWDRIRAQDLFTVFNSFKPPGSCIHSVKIYPSEFGLKRMEEENLKGPPELTEETLDPDTEEVLDKKKAKYHREKLREYQLKRLQYYYAVVECDTPETADYLYTELNLKEYESSSLSFDLRFIPDDVTFDHEPVSEVHKMSDPSEYQPRLFNSTALGQVKVDLTWDETDPQRREILQKAFTEPESIEKDLKDYLASSSGESEEEQEICKEDKKMKLQETIAKYKELLKSFEEKEGKEDNKFEKEITWEPGLKEKTEKIVKQKLEDTKNPFDEMLKKKKEERKLKKKEKIAGINEDEDEASSDFEENDSDFFSGKKPSEKESNKKLNELYLISDSKKPVEGTKEKRKRKKKKPMQKDKTEEPLELQFLQDERFSAIFTSPEYNIDPSDPHFKKTEGTLALIQEKQKRMKDKEQPPDEKIKNKKFKYN